MNNRAIICFVFLSLSGCGEVKDMGTCAISTTSCGGECIDSQNDPDNCGGCGNACSSSEVCIAGQCTLQCNGGTTNCDGTCINTSNDPAHCGGCGNSCASDICTNLTCVPLGYYVLATSPDPRIVFDMIAETYMFNNNLTNSIWHRQADIIVTGQFEKDGYWAFSPGTANISTLPNNGTDIHTRMVQIPATDTVVYSRSPPADGVGPATSMQFVVATIDSITGLLSGDQPAIFTDGFTDGCRLTSSSGTELLCYDGSGIRRYRTALNSPILTFMGTLALSAMLPEHAQCAPAHPCYGSTFAFDGAFYYFAANQGSFTSLSYIVYNATGTFVGQFTAAGSGSINGVYFDWSVGRYSSHDSFGNRTGLVVFGTGDDAHNFGFVSAAHALR
jgi:hypothetical protein